MSHPFCRVEAVIGAVVVAAVHAQVAFRMRKAPRLPLTNSLSVVCLISLPLIFWLSLSYLRYLLSIHAHVPFLTWK